LLIYGVTILLEVPFVNSSLYEGPIAKHLGGADISWIVGLVFATVAYYLYAKWQGISDQSEGEVEEVQS